jgi:hypothetical protein
MKNLLEESNLFNTDLNLASMSQSAVLRCGHGSTPSGRGLSKTAVVLMHLGLTGLSLAVECVSKSHGSTFAISRSQETDVANFLEHQGIFSIASGIDSTNTASPSRTSRPPLRSAARRPRCGDTQTSHPAWKRRSAKGFLATFDRRRCSNIILNGPLGWRC